MLNSVRTMLIFYFQYINTYDHINTPHFIMTLCLFYACPMSLLHLLFFSFSYFYCFPVVIVYFLTFVMAQLRTYLFFVFCNDEFLYVEICTNSSVNPQLMCTIKSLYWCVTCAQILLSAFCAQNYCSIDISDQMKWNNGVYLHNTAYAHIFHTLFCKFKSNGKICTYFVC